MTLASTLRTLPGQGHGRLDDGVGVRVRGQGVVERARVQQTRRRHHGRAGEAVVGQFHQPLVDDGPQPNPGLGDSLGVVLAQLRDEVTDIVVDQARLLAVDGPDRQLLVALALDLPLLTVQSGSSGGAVEEPWQVVLYFGLPPVVLASVGLCVHGYAGTGTEIRPRSHPVIPLWAGDGQTLPTKCCPRG
ncbi:hypothetical protein ACFU3E_07460 [Streptomyces sp. NPDC057424]|uniref:hypothetical protein n=1 Tax=Streptomyces sp. NPDC057424 TaxID=3346127 RepID=UPI00368C730F